MLDSGAIIIPKCAPHVPAACPGNDQFDSYPSDIFSVSPWEYHQGLAGVSHVRTKPMHAQDWVIKSALADLGRPFSHLSLKTVSSFRQTPCR